MDIPRHIAIIPDGNRRWAKQLKKTTLQGHERGYIRLQECISYARTASVSVITVWAFSTENWKRKKEEIDGLMLLMIKGLSKIHKDAKKEKTRVVHIGRRDRLNDKLLKLIEKVEEETKNYTDFCLCIALDYGGDDEILRAQEKLRTSTDMNKKIQDFLDTQILELPFPDLIIRTGGEIRTSGFMPLQSAYAEWFFEERMFPDFTTEVFKKIIQNYTMRSRRFGK